MNRITQEAKKRQSVVKLAKKGNSSASKMYGVSLSSVKRWCKRYDGTWKPLAERSHRPHGHPKQHSAEEAMITEVFKKKYARYGWDGVYDEAVSNGYTAQLQRTYIRGETHWPGCGRQTEQTTAQT